ncbi:MAG: hypothetical protein ACFE0Q_16050 [Anaerolineae bacterium]
MKIRLLLILCGLLLLSVPAYAQDDTGESDEEIAYLRLNSTFSVPEIRGWAVTAENETVLFERDDINAQIYVRIVDTLNTDEAIDTAITDIEALQIDTAEVLLTGRIGRNNGTWNYRILQDGNTSVTAYALLQSNRVYVVLFAEDSADYDAYHLAVRSTNNSPETDEATTEAINLASMQTIASLLDADFEGEPESTRYPAEDNTRWLEAVYNDETSTASYLFDGIIYVTLVRGDESLTAELSDAFDSVFLGFVITPNNIEYLYLGLAFSAVILLGLLGSMILRYQNLKKDLAVIEQLADDN